MKEAVSGHKRRDHNGVWRTVKKFERKAKPKKSVGIKRAETRNFRVTYFRDSQGRLVSKRIYKKR